MGISFLNKCKFWHDGGSVMITHPEWDMIVLTKFIGNASSRR